MGAAAESLAAIGNSLDAVTKAAAEPTTGVVPAAADEVSALTAAQFATHAQMFQAVSAQASEIQNQFWSTLQTSGLTYGATEIINTLATG
jgi:hypothetical protein